MMWNPAKAGSTGNSAFDVWAVLNGSGNLQTYNVNGDGIDQILAHVEFGNLIEEQVTPYTSGVSRSPRPRNMRSMAGRPPSISRSLEEEGVFCCPA